MEPPYIHTQWIHNSHSGYKQISLWVQRGSELASPICTTSTWELFWAEGNWERPCVLTRNVNLFLKMFELRALPTISYQQKYFLWSIYRAGQMSNYWTAALILQMTFLPSEAQVSYLILSSECHTSLTFLFFLCTSHVCGISICMCVLTFVYFLLLIGFMSLWLLDQAKEPKQGRGKSPPPHKLNM